MERAYAGELARHIFGNCARRNCNNQRSAQKISETFALRRPHAICKLFYDYHFSDSGAHWHGLDVEPVCGNCFICRPDLAAAAFWINAAPQSLNFFDSALPQIKMVKR